MGPGWLVRGNPDLIWAPFDPEQAGRTDDAARAADLQQALADERVRAIVPLRGGAWLLRILERLDLAVLKRRRDPVYLVGFSEWTCLSLLAARYPSAISVHHTSPLYMLPTDPHDPLSHQQKQRRWREVWATIRGIVTGKDPKRPLKGRLITPASLPDQTVRLTGGNLTLIAAMAGTPYQPAAAARGMWLALEDINETIGRIDRKFAQMRLAGMLDGVKGVLLGGFHSEGSDAGPAVAALLRMHIPPHVPIVASCNFGHFWPAAPFPLASPVRLVAGPRHSVRLEVNWSALARH
jgi:muramoyltetrapeptide carboxypeptidase